jgi:hypothetical protein
VTHLDLLCVDPSPLSVDPDAPPRTVSTMCSRYVCYTAPGFSGGEEVSAGIAQALGGGLHAGMICNANTSSILDLQYVFQYVDGLPNRETSALSEGSLMRIGGERNNSSNATASTSTSISMSTSTATVADVIYIDTELKFSADRLMQYNSTSSSYGWCIIP